MTFKEFLKESPIAVKSSSQAAPMVIMLRRIAVRQFPRLSASGSEYVVLYGNQQLGIQVAVPVDQMTGKLRPANMLPMSEEHNAYSEGMSKEEVVIALQSAYDEAKLDQSDELNRAIVHWLNAEQGQFGPFDQMPESNLRDNWDDYCALTSGINEETINELSSETLKSYVNKAQSHVNYLEDSPKTHRSLAKRDRRMAGQINAIRRLKKKMGLEEQIKGNQLQRIRNKPTRVIKGFDDWHDQVTLHNPEAQFKIHNNAKNSSAYSNGKHIGTFDHERKTGTLVHEELILESPMHKLNVILKTGNEQEVEFNNGATSRIHPNTAKIVNDLWHKVNSTNKAKLSELINSSPEGLVKVAKMAANIIGSK